MRIELDRVAAAMTSRVGARVAARDTATLTPVPESVETVELQRVAQRWYYARFPGATHAIQAVVEDGGLGSHEIDVVLLHDRWFAATDSRYQRNDNLRTFLDLNIPSK